MYSKVLFLILFPLFAYSQAPQKINFQSILRNTNGEVVANKSVSLKISILSDSISGSSVYSETHTKTTDISGLISIQIGNGTVLSGVFDNIDWGNTSHFIKLEADFNGGSNYVVLGTQELMSVPYALYAGKTDTTVLNLTSRFSTKLNVTDTAALSARINALSSLSDTSLLNLTNRFSSKVNISDTTGMLLPYLRDTDTTAMLVNYLTGINAKVNIADTSYMLANYRTGLNEKVNIADTSNMLANYRTGLNNKVNVSDTSSMLANYRTGLNEKVNIADTSNMLANYRTGLNAKAPINNPTFTGTVHGLDKSMVGLHNVDNTSDANKPVSVVTQAALDLKLNRSDFPSGTTGISGSDTINYIPKFTGTTKLGNSVIYDIDGKVGIGNNDPIEKLTISGGNILMNGLVDGLLMNPGSGAGSLAITRGGTITNNIQQINPPYTDNVGSSSGGGAQIALLKNEMSFSTYPNTGVIGSSITLTERMRITSTGVGIGTTNPNYKLHVEGSGTANEIVGWFNNQGAFSSSLAIRQASKTAYLTNHSGLGTPNYDGQLSNALSFGVSSGASPIQFWNGNTGVGFRGTAKLTILENGNIGIGTTTPAYPLDVNGSAKMTTIRDAANSVGTSGQVLSSTGSALSWVAPSASVQMVNIADTSNMLANYRTGLNNKVNVSDTSSMLANYRTGLNEKVNIADTSNMLANYRTGLNAKAPINNPTFTGTVHGLDKSMVGLHNVDNTSDANKPVSVVTQAALDLKLNRSDFPSGTTGISGSDTINYIPKFTGTTKLGNSVIYDIGGKVGIGNNDPIEKLTISGGNILMNGSFDGLLMNPGTGAGSLAITRGGTITNNIQQIYSPYTDNVGVSSGGGAQIALLKNEMSFSTYPSTGVIGSPITLTERMRITSTGVGIGTTNPNYKLHVEGSGTANEIVGWFNNQGAFSSSLAIRQASKTAYLTNHSGLGTPNYDGQLSNALSFGVSSGASPIQFWNGNTGVGFRGTAKLTILENGNIGIGTTTPAYPLDVNGSTKMTTIRDNANSVGTSGQVLSSTGSALSWVAPSASVQMAVIRETQMTSVPSGVTFTDFTSTAQSKPRQFNSKTEAGLGITLSGSPNWTFTISTAGTYLFEATAMLSVPTADNQTVFAKLVLNDITRALGSVIVGDSYRYGPVSSNMLTDSNFPHHMNGIYTIAGTTVFKLDHVINSQYFTPTGGKPSNVSGFEEVYATLKITKIN